MVQEKRGIPASFHQLVVFLSKRNYCGECGHTDICILQLICAATDKVFFALYERTPCEQVGAGVCREFHSEIFYNSGFEDNFWGALEETVLRVGSADREFFMQEADKEDTDL